MEITSTKSVTPYLKNIVNELKDLVSHLTWYILSHFVLPRFCNCCNLDLLIFSTLLHLWFTLLQLILDYGCNFDTLSNSFPSLTDVTPI